MNDGDLLATAARTVKENEARTPQEWCDKASDAVRELRGALREAIKIGNADVEKDGPMSPVSALFTASFVHVGSLVHALEWLERSIQPNDLSKAGGE